MRWKAIEKQRVLRARQRPRVSTPPIEETPGLGFWRSRKPMKTFFFSTGRGDFSFDASKEKWGRIPPAKPALPGARQGASPPGTRQFPAPKPAHPPSRRDDSRPRWGRQSCRFLETGSLFPPLAALRLFPPAMAGSPRCFSAAPASSAGCPRRRRSAPDTPPRCGS